MFYSYITASEVSDSWPSKGDIRLREVDLRYDATLDPVLHNINLHIPGGSKVGGTLLYTLSHYRCSNKYFV